MLLSACLVKRLHSMNYKDINMRNVALTHQINLTNQINNKNIQCAVKCNEK